MIIILRLLCFIYLENIDYGPIEEGGENSVLHKKEGKKKTGSSSGKGPKKKGTSKKEKPKKDNEVNEIQQKGTEDMYPVIDGEEYPNGGDSSNEGQNAKKKNKKSQKKEDSKKKKQKKPKEEKKSSTLAPSNGLETGGGEGKNPELDKQLINDK
uniref:Uncharacterized protein n=1 Tax=Strongyloides papillosus TaxID=174720 RepID=A0A0N5BDS6_STREA